MSQRNLSISISSFMRQIYSLFFLKHLSCKEKCEIRYTGYLDELEGLQKGKMKKMPFQNKHNFQCIK